MDYKIVMDSAGDMLEFPGAQYACVPLKILAGDREFVDDATTDVVEMVDYLGTYVGKSSTACPSAGEYLEAFEDAEDVYCVTITSGLSGSYNAATVASQTYLVAHEIVHCRPLTFGGMDGLHRFSSRRQFVYDRYIEVSVKCHGECPWYRSRSHDQYVGSSSA